MAADLAGRHALVTGGNKGIGAAIATAFAQAGACITILGRDAEALEQQRAALSRVTRVTAIQADVTSEGEVASSFDAAQKALGPIDILVNNAGISGSAPLAKIDLSSWNAMIAVNMTAAMLGCRAAIPGMAERGFGRVINIASAVALQGYAFISAYTASKHGLMGFTRAIALEFARKGVTVNAICPSYTDTDMVKRAIASVSSGMKKTEDEALALLLKGNPQNRLVQPDEVAQTALWLCSPAAQSVTGQAISMTGGEVMR